LVKVAHGTVLEASVAKQHAKTSSKDDKKAALKSTELGRTMALMGIMSASGSTALALPTTPEEAARVMRWDLVNPWARFYELDSTRPLPAMRLRALNREAEALSQGVAYPLLQHARVRWANFPLEFIFWVASLLCGFLLITWE
jgi:hypothetical protein